jgi:steroid Delta-isomerase
MIDRCHVRHPPEEVSRVSELEEAMRTHVELFNAAVRSGDWTDFVATFADDAVMMFVDIPTGPYVGRDAIIDAYRTQPPTDTMTISSINVDAPDTATALFRWDAGTTGSMTIRWVAGKIAELTVASDTNDRADL